jgi:hypothetical protein
MEPFSEVTDTTILIAKSAISNRYFSVAPILASGTIMAKGSAVNYSQQGTGCFVQSFLADKTGLNTATLTLQLGTAYKVAGIVFEQYQSNGPQTVFSTAANGALLYSSVVSPLKKGISLFRAKIILADGAIVYSDWVELINADEPGYLIFPNPVHRNETLQLITAAPNGESFVLYNATGNKIIEKTIAQVKENISSRQLQAGIYFYKIVKDGRNIRSGKIIVL